MLLKPEAPAAVQTLTDSIHMSEADATKMVDEWMKSYNDLKSELEHVRTAAEHSSC